MPTCNGRPPRRDTCSSLWLELWFLYIHTYIRTPHQKKHKSGVACTGERGGAAPDYFGLRLRSLFCGVPDLPVAWQRVVASGSS